MAITATDTGNQFGDVWKSAEAAVTGNTKLPSGAGADQTQYADAWNAENSGVYGSLDKGVPTPVPAPAAAAAKAFAQQLNRGDPGYQNGTLMLRTDPNYNPRLDGMSSTGSYGSFKYGDVLPSRGTEQWRDMSEYLAMGGNDPTGYLKDAVFQSSWDTAPQRSYTGYENGQYGN